jgi:hypothetical protein
MWSGEDERTSASTGSPAVGSRRNEGRSMWSGEGSRAAAVYLRAVDHQAAMKAAPCGAAKHAAPPAMRQATAKAHRRNEGRSMWSGEADTHRLSDTRNEGRSMWS